MNIIIYICVKFSITKQQTMTTPQPYIKINIAYKNVFLCHPNGQVEKAKQLCKQFGQKLVESGYTNN